MDTIDLAREMFEDQSFPMYQIEDFVKILTLADELYHSSDDESFLTDAEYDFLYQFAEKVDPTDVYFLGIGSDVRGEKIKLPYPMPGLSQVQVGEIASWIINNNLNNEQIVLTDKLDGISAQIIYNKSGKLQIAFSRGNGIMGADLTRHISKMRSIPKTIKNNLVVRGEIIIESSTFPFISETFKRKSGKTYKTSRNAVSGFMNAKENKIKIYDYIKFVAYQIVNSNASKANQLLELEKNGFEVAHSQIVYGHELNDTYLSKSLNLRKQNSVYLLDGIVCDINSAAKRFESNIDNNTPLPKCTIKYKVNDDNNFAVGIVENITWEISKHGFIKPVINIVPIDLDGVTVSKCTGFNARYIYENKIQPGCEIEMTRSGNVIPFCLRVRTKGSLI